MYRDRRDAGRILAEALSVYRDDPHVVVLALPRGGVPVAFEVARALEAPLDVCLVRKLGTPGQPELAMGAVADGGVRILNRDVVAIRRVSAEEIAAVEAVERTELERRAVEYRGGRPPLDVQGATVIIVDDGLATGASMRAAVEAVRARRPSRIVVAVPTAPRQTCEELKALADDVVCALAPPSFVAVGQWYDDFRQTTDDEVLRLLS